MEINLGLDFLGEIDCEKLVVASNNMLYKDLQAENKSAMADVPKTSRELTFTKRVWKRLRGTGAMKKLVSERRSARNFQNP